MISPPLLDNEATSYPPGVYPGAWLDESGDVVTDEDGNPILLGPDTLYPPDLGDGPTLAAPTITVGPVSLFAPLIDGQTIYAPTVSAGVVSLLAPLVESVPTTYTPAVDTLSGLRPPLLGDGAAAFAPALTVGAVSLQPPTLSADPGPLAPAVTGGSGDLIVTARIGLAHATMTIGCSPRSRDYWS